MLYTFAAYVWLRGLTEVARGRLDGRHITYAPLDAIESAGHGAGIFPLAFDEFGALAGPVLCLELIAHQRTNRFALRQQMLCGRSAYLARDTCDQKLG